MSFIHPGFLWALLFIAVPIIIHLVNLRRHKTVYFSNVNLLKLVQKQTKKRSKLKQLLILFSRIMMIAFLAMAFAKPYIPTDNLQKQRENNIVGIYIDNSFSMNAEGKEGRAIDNARQKAFTIVSNSRADSRFALITNDLTEQQTRFYSRAEIMNLIADVKISHNWLPINTLLLRFNSMVNNFLFESNNSLYIISDFQQYTSKIQETGISPEIQLNLVPIEVNSVSNLYLDSCWFEAPTHHLNQQEVLFARLTNNSSEDYFQLTVNLFINDSLRSLATIDLDAGKSEIIELQYNNLSTGMQYGKIEISDFPIVYDNQLFFAYDVKEQLTTLVIEDFANQTSKSLKALFASDEYIKLDVEMSARVQISSFSNYSTIVLNELKDISTGLQTELQKYARNGGTLIVIPSTRANLNHYNAFFRSINADTIVGYDTVSIPISKIEFEHPVYRNVFKDKNQDVNLPAIKERYRFNSNQSAEVYDLLTFADQTSALDYSFLGEGTIVKFAFPLSPTVNNFTRHLLFVPTFYNLFLQSSSSQKPYYILGKDRSFNLQLKKTTPNTRFEMRHVETGNSFIPEIIYQRGNNIRFAVNNDYLAGHYQILNDNNTLLGIAFNYNLQESQLDYFDSDELESLFADAGLLRTNVLKTNNQGLSERIEELDSGTQLWKWFVIMILFFLIAESAIIRFMK